MSATPIIALEGVDGSGKHTQATLLVNALKSRGLKAELIGFPDYNESQLGPVIGKMLKGAYGDLGLIHPIFTATLFAVERFEKKLLVQSLQDSGTIVVFDRYVYSNAAHQACRLPLNERAEFISWLETLEFEVLGMPKPSFTILLDLDDDDSRHLRESRSAHEYSGSVLDVHERDLKGIANAREIYLDLAEKLHWTKVVCSDAGAIRKIEDISDELIRSVLGKI